MPENLPFLNALLKEEKAIVSDIAGTTRDAIEDEVILEGIRFRFIDTAGLRETDDTIEAIGVKKSLEKMQQASLVLYLYDASTENLEVIRDHVSELRQELSDSSTRLLVIANKWDLINDPSSSLPEDYLQLSAKSGSGVNQLIENLLSLVKSGQAGGQDTILTNARHLCALSEADDALMRAYTGLDTGITGDFIAMDIRQSLHYLGEITGEITTDDLLGNIFGKFCIGK